MQKLLDGVCLDGALQETTWEREPHIEEKKVKKGLKKASLPRAGRRTALAG